MQAELHNRRLVHQLKTKVIVKRMQRFWKLYTKLRIGNLKNYATSDETRVHIGLGSGRIKVCNMRKVYNNHYKMNFVKLDGFAAGLHCIFLCLL